MCRCCWGVIWRFSEWKSEWMFDIYVKGDDKFVEVEFYFLNVNKIVICVWCFNY